MKSLHHPLLIVVDMQEGFRYPAPVAMMSHMERLVREFKGPIIFFCFHHRPGSMFERELNWKRFQDKESQEIFYELKPYAKTKMKHEGYTVVTPALLKYIQKNKIDKVIIAGIYSDVSITKATMDFFDRGISCAVVSDCCAAQNNVSNEEIMGSIGRQIGRHNVIRAADLLNP